MCLHPLQGDRYGDAHHNFHLLLLSDAAQLSGWAVLRLATSASPLQDQTHIKTFPIKAGTGLLYLV
jgi:hypothetical protein